MGECCICGGEVQIRTETLSDGNKKFINAMKFAIREGVYDRIQWHDYCGAFCIFAIVQQKNANDAKARALAIEGLNKMKQGANKIRLIPKEFLYA